MLMECPESSAYFQRDGPIQGQYSKGWYLEQILEGSQHRENPRSRLEWTQNAKKNRHLEAGYC